MRIARAARLPGPGPDASLLLAGKPPAAPGKAVWGRTTCSSSCASRARPSLSATDSLTMRRGNRLRRSVPIRSQPVNRDDNPLPVVARVRPWSGTLLTFIRPSTGADQLEESGSWRASRLGQPQFAAGRDDPLHQAEQRFHVATLIENVSR